MKNNTALYWALGLAGLFCLIWLIAAPFISAQPSPDDPVVLIDLDQVLLAVVEPRRKLQGKKDELVYFLCHPMTDGYTRIVTDQEALGTVKRLRWLTAKIEARDRIMNALLPIEVVVTDQTTSAGLVWSKNPLKDGAWGIE